jgi:CRP/FNR family transcriptional regulator, cyclic AMP receptor protein
MDDRVLEQLKRTPLLAALCDDADHLERIASICAVRSVPKGRVVIREGERGSEMFIMITGSVEIQRMTRAGDVYTVVRLYAQDNVFFGEMALIDDDLRSATIVTTDDSEFLVLSKSDFLSLGDQFPQVALPITREIARILSGRLRKTTGDMLTIFDALVNELQQ